MEMEPDIKNMTLNEYLEYEAKKERRLWDNVRSNSSPTRDTNHESSNLLNFPIFSATNEFSKIYEQDVDMEKEEVEVEDDDDGDTYDIWHITVKDVERIRKFLMPNVPDELDKSILDELLEEFNDEIMNVTMVNEEAAKDPQLVRVGNVESQRKWRYLFWKKNVDAHEHVQRVIDIVSLFNILGVSHDAVMLHVFPITLTGAAKRWVDRLHPRTVKS
ncbi:hypothetical protein Tco_0064343 [Tanacetum coccineum]